MISRFSRRSLFLPVVLLMLLILPDGSGCSQDVDHEVQRVGALDAGLVVALLAVAVGRGDREDHPAADRRADQSLVPAGHDLAHTDGEGGGLSAVALVEGLLALVDLAEVVDRDVLALLDLVTRTHDESGRAELAVRRRRAAEVKAGDLVTVG